ncbi:MAG TPA: response regulator [Methylococcaceae bacterium]|nr:response regulator [Methylococcaceae bacterium]
MADRDREFQEHLFDIFKTEAREHLGALSSLLLELENPQAAAQCREHLEVLFREAHSLKGAARAVGFGEIETVCQALESLLSRLKREELGLSPVLFNLLHQALDCLENLLAAPRRDFSWEVRNQLAELIRLLQNPPDAPTATAPPAEAPPPVAAAQPVPEPRRPAGDTVRIAMAKLDALLFQVEELRAAQIAFGHLVEELRALDGALSVWAKAQGQGAGEARAALRALDKNPGTVPGEAARLIKLLEPLAGGDTAVKSLSGVAGRLLRSAEQDRRAFGSMVTNLQEEAKHFLMLPLASLLEGFPKMTRDLARDKNKAVDLLIEGGELEIDRRILEEIKDPLIHLLRNCVDHGIETSTERARANKPARGRIVISAAPKGSGKVEILVEDDGAGIDAAKVKTAADKLGLLPPGSNNLEESEIVPLIFQSGLTTSAFITDLSGRGLGLAIVREKAEKLGGTATVETRPGQGSTFRLLLPSTFAGFRGVLVRVGVSLFALPSNQVARTLRLSPEAVGSVENRETIRLDDTPLALVSLGEILELPRSNAEGAVYLQAVVLALGGERIAFRVDEIVDEREVLAKRLEAPLLRLRHVSGATLVGGGKIMPILNVSDLMKAAAGIGAAPSTAAPEAQETEAADRNLLVVEDSITARTLLKNILESAGYTVKTAVDGIDAFTLLRTQDFDLVVSDVDMPRMNGFDLTARIRSEKKLAELPVVLVTALESREDRERGIDVGANAYLVKSRFDQSNLLEAVRRLL